MFKYETVSHNKWKPLAVSFYYVLIKNRPSFISSPVERWTLWLYRFGSDMGWALWEVLSKYQFPEGREKQHQKKKRTRSSLIILCKICNHFLFSSCFSSPSFLPSLVKALLCGTYVCSKAETIIPPIRKGELELIILKRTWKAEVGTVSLY